MAIFAMKVAHLHECDGLYQEPLETIQFGGNFRKNKGGFKTVTMISDGWWAMDEMINIYIWHTYCCST